MSKRDMDYFIEKVIKEIIMQHLTEKDQRSMAALKGWETRRKKSP